jgi:hypothetical protein
MQFLGSAKQHSAVAPPPMATEPDAYLRSALLRRATAATLDDESSGSGSSSGGSDESITAPPPRAAAAVTRAWVGAEPAEELHCHVCLDVMQQARSLACAVAPPHRSQACAAAYPRRCNAARRRSSCAAAALPLH